MMKKLLLVMLVPVLVLGLLSCGKVMDGEKVLSAMQGGWIVSGGTNLDDVAFVLTPNQATIFKFPYDLEMGTIAFRTEYIGPMDTQVTAKTYTNCEIHFYDFEEGTKKEMGWIVFDFVKAADPNNDQIQVTKSEKIYHYQNYMIPPTGDYDRMTN